MGIEIPILLSHRESFVDTSNFKNLISRYENTKIYYQTLLSIYYCIYAQDFSSINRNLPKLDNFEQILKKFKIWKILNALIDFGQIQYLYKFLDRYNIFDDSQMVYFFSFIT